MVSIPPKSQLLIAFDSSMINHNVLPYYQSEVVFYSIFSRCCFLDILSVVPLALFQQ